MHDLNPTRSDPDSPATGKSTCTRSSLLRRQASQYQSRRNPTELDPRPREDAGRATGAPAGPLWRLRGLARAPSTSKRPPRRNLMGNMPLVTESIGVFATESGVSDCDDE